MLNPIHDKRRLLLGLVNAFADLSLSNFVYFYGPTFNHQTKYQLDNLKNIIQHDRFNPRLKTVLYLHGYLEKLQDESVQVITDAYLKRHDINLIVLDWSKLADGNYLFDSVVNTKQLGSKIAKILLDMIDSKLLDINYLHIVGHSLGGQMAGIIGREIQRRSNNSRILKRITGLDPAFPPFYFTFADHINKNDAEFVDIIHTDAWLYGAPVSTGTADFWPNGGITLQPGCPKRNYKLLTDNDLSSHRRSWWYWAESVSNRYSVKFLAVKAKSWNDFKSNRTIDDGTEKNGSYICMGDECPLNISGDYYLQTNGQIPFARGYQGTKYIPQTVLIKDESLLPP